MYICYICEGFFGTLYRFRAHIKEHFELGEVRPPIRCGQPFCKSSYSRVAGLLRHLRSHHSGDEEGPDLRGIEWPDASSVATVSAARSPMASLESSTTAIHSKTARETLSGLQCEGSSLVSSLRANSSIPFSVIPGIVESLDSMVNIAITAIVSEVTQVICDSGLSKELESKVGTALHGSAYTLFKPLDFLSSRYKQDKFFDKHPLAVNCKSVTLGKRYVLKRGITKQVYDSYQYVSVKETVNSLLCDHEYMELLLRDKVVPGVISECWDGWLCKQHPLLADASKFSIAIQLFYDSMGTTNPLRGTSSIYSTGIFYFTVKNLPNVINSSHSNIHLVALCHAPDLKTYGFASVLRKFVEEMQELSINGFVGTFPIIGCKRVYVTLLQTTGDNLALNGLLGFIESFRSDYFCTMCFATQDDIQLKFYQEDFLMRSVVEYSADIAALGEGIVHSRGVKRDCLLNQIPGYHVTRNFSLDIMHIVLEGVVPFELSCILYGLCNQMCYVSLSDVSQEIAKLWGTTDMDQSNRPPILKNIDKPGRLSPSMKASQAWSLLKYLPLAVGDRVPSNDSHLLFLLDLSNLVDLLFSPQFTAGMVDYLRHCIAEHLSSFVALYGHGVHARKLRPKHHLLIHLPSIILASGPLVGMNCMRYEQKNSFFKRSAHVMCNFTNVCRTLAYKHQQYSLFCKLSKTLVRDKVTVEHVSCYGVESLPYADLIIREFNLCPGVEMCTSKRLSRASITYSVNQFVVVGFADDEPVFGQITLFVSLPLDDKWYAVVRCLKTVCFWNHFYCYQVDNCDPCPLKVVALSDLNDYHCVVCHKKKIAGKWYHFIRLPYHLF